MNELEQVYTALQAAGILFERVVKGLTIYPQPCYAPKLRNFRLEEKTPSRFELVSPEEYDQYFVQVKRARGRSKAAWKFAHPEKLGIGVISDFLNLLNRSQFSEAQLSAGIITPGTYERHVELVPGVGDGWFTVVPCFRKTETIALTWHDFDSVEEPILLVP